MKYLGVHVVVVSFFCCQWKQEKIDGMSPIVFSDLESESNLLNSLRLNLSNSA